MKELLKDKTIRMYIFGMFQWFIGIFGLGYLTSQCYNTFDLCLSVFTLISLAFGVFNIKTAEKRMAATAVLTYVIAKMRKDEATINRLKEYDEIQHIESMVEIEESKEKINEK